MSRDGHNYARAVVRVHECRWEDENLSPCEGIGNALSYQILSRYLRAEGDASVCEGQLLIGLFRDHPCFLVDPGQDIIDIRIQPEVGHSEDRLRPQCSAGQNPVAHAELDQGEVHDGGILSLEDVVILNGIFVVRTPAHRVAALDHIIQSAQYAILPLDELAVGRIGGGELPPPVYGVAYGLHGPLGLTPEVKHNFFRRVQAGQLLLRNAVQLGVDIPDQWVPVGN